jgi:hypothetical protein
MDMTFLVGTDIAGFMLYEPEALRHRATAPWGWFSDFSQGGEDLGDLTVPERADGRLALIGTAIPVYLEEEDRLLWVGSDGAYRFRCTTGGLTSDEAQREYPETRETPEVHTIHVIQDRLLLDGGYLIPCDYAGEGMRVTPLAEALEHQLVAWLALPNGTYQVTVHHLRTAGEEEEEGDEDYAPDDEVSIVLTFDRVSDAV